ncbi:MAG TPA: fused MFS/spermidine synthase [Blastocatellia bacterium]|nr:fused MFS/spermidine synthase [Blastocatellia bacterium]
MSKSQAVTRTERPAIAWAVLLCFFASGISGLVYQVVWVRELVLVFGATTFAVSTVLTAFMGGLALGSFYFGRRSESIPRPLRLYGWLEIGIGVYGLAVPFIFAALPVIYHPIWRWLQLSFFTLSLVRFLFAALVLILPTALMGATLPVLASYYARDAHRIGLRVGSLYALNTFGAVIGAAVTGFALIPLLGMHATTATAAAINITLGLAALRISRLEEADGEISESGLLGRGQEIASPTAAASAKVTSLTNDNLSRRALVVILVSFAVSGFIALAYEVIWSRVLALIIGSSVYAFSIMLTTFLTGLAAGAAAVSRFADRIRRPVMAFAIIEIGVGVTSFIGAHLFNDLPYVFVQLYRIVGSGSFTVLLFARFLISALVMIGPTLLLGALFPLVVRIISTSQAARRSGRTVGEAYAANTIGAIVGSFASGFILIPVIGLLGSLRLCAALNFVVAAALFFVLPKRETNTETRRRGDTAARREKNTEARRPAKSPPVAASPARPLAAWAGIAVSALAIIGIVVFEPAWDSQVMSSAVYRYAPQLSNKSKAEISEYLRRGQGESIYYKEGITATVAVQRMNEGRVLKVNGKPEASTTGDMPTQILIGSLPLLVRQQTDDVLLIGLGSGVTLGSVEQFPVKRVTCVELEPAVVEATHYFEDVNNRPLQDPRLRLISNDGRNFIYTTDEKFDVIISEPSNPWLTGVANLFTLEYFKRGAERLKEDGLFGQWLQLYEMAPEDVRTLIATFHAAFPYVYIFRGAEGDLMLLGSKMDRKLDLQVMQAHFNEAPVAADLKRIKTTQATDLLSRFYLGPQEVADLTNGAQLNTDNNALIEFNAPRRVGTTEETVERNVKQLLAHAVSPLAYLEGRSPLAASDADLLAQTALGAVKRDDHARAEQFVNYSLGLADTAQANGMLGELRAARGDEAGALEAWETALVLDPKHFYSLLNIGKLYLTRQDTARAVPYLDRALTVQPDSARAHHLRGLAYQANGDNSRAALEYRKTLSDAQYARSIPTFYLNFGTALVQLGLYEEAVQLLSEYVKLAPADFDAHYQLGAALEIQSERSLDEATTRRAVQELQQALKLQPNHAMAHYYLGKAYRRLELYDLADAEFEAYERLSS